MIQYITILLDSIYYLEQLGRPVKCPLEGHKELSSDMFLSRKGGWAKILKWIQITMVISASSHAPVSFHDPCDAEICTAVPKFKLQQSQII